VRLSPNIHPFPQSPCFPLKLLIIRLQDRPNTGGQDRELTASLLCLKKGLGGFWHTGNMLARQVARVQMQGACIAVRSDTKLPRPAGWRNSEREIVVKKKQVAVTSEKTGQYISTLEAAKLCGVSTFSIQRWFDEGLLVGARLPGGKRKIAADSLKRFMQEHGLLPAEGAKVDTRRVLVIDRDARTLDTIKEHLAQTGEFLIQTASNGLDAGLAAAEFKPDVVIINVGIEDVPMTSIIQRVHQSPVTRHARLIAVANKGTSEEARDAEKAGADAFLSKPLNIKELQKAVRK